MPIQLVRIAVLEFDTIGDDFPVLARRCDLDVGHRQQFVLTFERLIDSLRRLLATGHLPPPFIGKKFRPALMLEAYPLAIGLKAALITYAQRRRLFGVVEVINIL